MHLNVISVATRIGRYRFNRRNGVISLLLILSCGLEAARPVSSSPTIPEGRDAAFRLQWCLREETPLYQQYKPLENDARWIINALANVLLDIPRRLSAGWIQRVRIHTVPCHEWNPVFLAPRHMPQQEEKAPNSFPFVVHLGDASASKPGLCFIYYCYITLSQPVAASLAGGGRKG